MLVRLRILLHKVLVLQSPNSYILQVPIFSCLFQLDMRVLLVATGTIQRNMLHKIYLDICQLHIACKMSVLVFVRKSLILWEQYFRRWSPYMLLQIPWWALVWCILSQQQARTSSAKMGNKGILRNLGYIRKRCKKRCEGICSNLEEFLFAC